MMAKTTARRTDVFESYIKPKAGVVKQSVCQCSFVISLVKTVALVLLYYCFSISLTFYNQRFIHRFRFPLSITLVHLVTKFIIAAAIRQCLTCRSGTDRIILPWSTYIKSVLPPGLFSSLDIGLSNWSFEFVTVSLYTMTKSTVIVFILGFSILFKLEKPRCSLILVIAFIAVGLFMFTYQSTQFNLEGFLLVLGASFLSGLRWTTAQLVLQRDELGLGNPLDMIYHIQPWMILALLPLSVGFESLHVATTREAFAFIDSRALLTNMALLLSGALLAFVMEYTEFLLLRFTSSITLSISGIFKEICTVGLAVEINGDKANPINIIGLIVCLIGIATHVIIKAVNRETEKKTKAHHSESMEMLIREENSDDEDDIFNIQRDR